MNEDKKEIQRLKEEVLRLKALVRNADFSSFAIQATANDLIAENLKLRIEVNRLKTENKSLLSNKQVY